MFKLFENPDHFHSLKKNLSEHSDIWESRISHFFNTSDSLTFIEIKINFLLYCSVTFYKSS